MMFVAVGRAHGEREPTLAVGPFDTLERAQAEAEALRSVTRGVYVVLSLHTPTRPPA